MKKIELQPVIWLTKQERNALKIYDHWEVEMSESSPITKKLEKFGKVIFFEGKILHVKNFRHGKYFFYGSYKKEDPFQKIFVTSRF